MIKYDNNYIDVTHYDFYPKMPSIIAGIRDKKSYVLIASLYDLSLIVETNPTFFSKSVHISKNSYYDKPFGWVYNRYGNSYINNEFRNM